MSRFDENGKWRVERGEWRGEDGEWRRGLILKWDLEFETEMGIPSQQWAPIAPSLPKASPESGQSNPYLRRLGDGMVFVY
jgi:hypothetical protein